MSSFRKPAFLLKMLHPFFPGNMGWNIIREDDAWAGNHANKMSDKISVKFGCTSMACSHEIRTTNQIRRSYKNDQSTIS